MPLINFGSDKDGANRDARGQTINNYVALIKNIEHQFLPKVIMVAAIDVNMCIAENRDDRLDWVPKQDKLWYRKFTIEIGNLIIGKKTFEMLPNRAKEHRTFWVFTKSIPFGTIQKRSKGVYLVNMKPQDFLKKQKNIMQFALVGGLQIFDLFAMQKLISMAYVTVVKKKGTKSDANCVPLFMQNTVYKQKITLLLQNITNIHKFTQDYQEFKLIFPTKDNLSGDVNDAKKLHFYRLKIIFN